MCHKSLTSCFLIFGQGCNVLFFIFSSSRSAREQPEIREAESSTQGVRYSIIYLQSIWNWSVTIKTEYIYFFVNLMAQLTSTLWKILIFMPSTRVHTHTSIWLQTSRLEHRDRDDSRSRKSPSRRSRSPAHYRDRCVTSNGFWANMQ